MATRRFTVDEYEQMVAAGILREDDRVELVEGKIVEMTPIGPRHASTVKRLNRLFGTRLGDAAVVGVQDPIRLLPRSMPEPDAVLLRPAADLYESQHPGPDDVLLVVEVSDSTAVLDRTVKMPMYARAGIVQAWLVDLTANVVEVYRLGPSGAYGVPEMVGREDTISVDAFPDLELTGSDILG